MISIYLIKSEIPYLNLNQINNDIFIRKLNEIQYLYLFLDI